MSTAPPSQSVDIKNQKKDRHSNTGVSGSPKKGGAGGKGNWGVGGLDDLKTDPIDRNDPNYDSEDEGAEGVVLAPAIVRNEDKESSKVEATLKEYFTSGDVSDVIASVKEIRESKRPYFVKKTLVTAMDYAPAQRESASKLLLKLGTVISVNDLSLGFQMAIDSLEDISLDVPNAPELLSKFIARAVFDEVIPPKFLKHAKTSNKEGDLCVRLANAFSNERFRADKLAHVWGISEESSIKRLRNEAHLIFDEYLSSRDMKEAESSLRNLRAPDFHFQVVREGIKVALEKDGEQREVVLQLLKDFSTSGLISPSHFSHGFETCYKTMEDLTLDLPKAPTVLPTFVERAKTEGWLDKEFNYQPAPKSS